MPKNPNQLHRILLVEDDRDMAGLLVALLGDAGYQVEMVFDGETALKTAEQFQPHVCLVNVNIPKLSGHDLAAYLRDRLEHPPVLANITPFEERDDWDADAEFDLDFTKPSDPLVIVDQLSGFLRNGDAVAMRSNPHTNRREKVRLPESRKDSLLHAAGSFLRK